MKKLHQREITGTIHNLTGLRIGGSDELLQIGGTDLTCIKHPVTLKPYIPGSSFKGKMRSELERQLGKFGGRDRNEPCGCARQDCLVCRIFGPHMRANHDLGPSRIIVRDATLKSGGELEVKSENIIDRRVNMARHPRKVERVVSGSEFELKISIQIWDMDDNRCSYLGKTSEDALIEFVKNGLRLVQQTGLGSGVSKGYGHIEFKDLKLDDVSFTL